MGVKDKSVILYLALCASLPKKFVTAAPNTHMLLSLKMRLFWWKVRII